MNTNKNTQENGYSLISNKGKTAKAIVLEANNGRTEDPNCHEWYGKMIHDAQLAASTENKALVSETIQSLFTSLETVNGERSTTMFFANYMDDPYAVQIHVAPDKDKPGFYIVNESEKRVDFFTMDKAYREKLDNKAATLASDGRYEKMVALFYDNCLRNIAKDMSPDAVKVTIPAITSYEDERKEYDFTSESINALEKQLNVIVTAIMGETAPQMRKADVRFILNAMTRAANNNKDAESKAHLVTVKEKAFINNLFRAIEARRDMASYKIDSKGNIHKAQAEAKVLVETETKAA